MSFKKIKKFCGENSLLIACGNCFFFAGLALFGKFLEPVISRDGVLYLQLADVWLRSGSYDEMLLQLPPDMVRIPVLPIFLLKTLIGIPPEIAGVGIPLIAGMTLPLLVYLMAQEIQSDKRVSLAASMLMAVNPSMIELSYEIQRDMIYIAFCGWSVFFGIKGLMQKKWWPWIPAGVLWSLAALCRYETFEWIPILIIVFLIFGVKKEISWKMMGQQAAVFVIALTITGLGLIYWMGIQDHVVSAYAKYIAGKADLLTRQTGFSEEK